MGTPGISSTSSLPATPEVQAPQAPARPQPAPAPAAAPAALSQPADVSLATPRPEATAPVAPGATFNSVSLASFLASFRTGDRVELDGPLWYNGTGTIARLDADHLRLNITGKIGEGTISVDRKAGDTFTATVNLDGETNTMTMRATRKGNTLDFVGVDDPSKQLHFTVSGNTVTLNPDGLGIPGAVDISKL